MIRLFALVVTLFAFTSFVHADEPKKPDVKLPAFAVEVQKIRKDLEEKLAPIYAAEEKEYEAAKTETEREAIVAKSDAEQQKINAPAYEQAMKLLRPNAADPAAIPGLVWFCISQRPIVHTEVVGLLRKHHLVHSETIAFTKGMKKSGHAWVEGLLREQLASADLPKDRAWIVHLSLAICIKSHAELPGLLAEASESDSRQYSRVFGKERVAEIQKYDPVKLETEALKLFTEVGEKYPTQLINPNLTVGQVAKSSIFEIKNLGVGKVAPDIEGEDLDGVKFKLSNYRGKTVMLSFWASWCGPCMGMIPHERELVDKYKERPFALIGVNGDPEKKDLNKVLETNKITWRSFWCGDKGPVGPIAMTWNVTSWPTVYVIDADGVIRVKNVHGTSLDARIEEWVKKTEAKK